MSEIQIIEPKQMLEKVQPDGALADYEKWFTEDRWHLDEAGTLLIGLNPDIVLNEEVLQKHSAPDWYDDLSGELYHYLDDLGYPDWVGMLKKSVSFVNGSCSAGDFRNTIDCNTLTLSPWDFIQWCVDEIRPMHYSLTEYLTDKHSYRFRYSKNSWVYYYR